jgi:hypothetical protein
MPISLGVDGNTTLATSSAMMASFNFDWHANTEEPPKCAVLVFRLKFALNDAIGSHACLLEALACVCPMGIPLGCSPSYCVVL